MRVRLLYKSKPNNHTESCLVNMADRWRERTCVSTLRFGPCRTNIHWMFCTNYAYGDKEGQATVRVELREASRCVCITFLDEGSPYAPLQKEDPDISLSAEEREIGGLGIYMVKRIWIIWSTGMKTGRIS